MKNNKWMKGLNKELIQDILKFDPISIDFEIKIPVEIMCTIKTKERGVGQGVAICSMLDYFDVRYGKNKVAGRALKALINKENSLPIRDEWEAFSDSWTKRRIERVMEVGSMYFFKSSYRVST